MSCQIFPIAIFFVTILLKTSFAQTTSQCFDGTPALGGNNEAVAGSPILLFKVTKISGACGSSQWLFDGTAVATRSHTFTTTTIHAPYNSTTLSLGITSISTSEVNMTLTILSASVIQNGISVRVTTEASNSATMTLIVTARCSVSTADDYCLPGSTTPSTSILDGTIVVCCGASDRSMVANCTLPGNLKTSLDCTEDDPPVGAIVGGGVVGVCLCVVGAAAYIFSVSIKVTPTPVGDKLSITIEWKAQSTPTVKYIVTWDPPGGSPKQPVSIDSSEGKLTIDGLDPGQHYTITVKPEHRLVPGFLGSTRTCAPKSA